MPTYTPLGNIFQIRPIETTDQALLEECLNQRFPSSERDPSNIAITIQNDMNMNNYIQNTAYPNLDIISYPGIISKQSDNLDMGYVNFIFIKMTSENKEYYADATEGHYGWLMPHFGFKNNLRGQQIGRIMIPFFIYFAKYTLPTMLNFTVSRSILPADPNEYMQFNNQVHVDSRGAGRSDNFETKSIDIPERSANSEFPVTSVFIVKIDQSDYGSDHINWEDVSENSDGKYYLPSNPTFSIANRLIEKLYDNIQPNGRSLNSVRNRIRGQFV
jgi:hypothetical protein